MNVMVVGAGRTCRLVRCFASGRAVARPSSPALFTGPGTLDAPTEKTPPGRQEPSRDGPRGERQLTRAPWVPDAPLRGVTGLLVGVVPGRGARRQGDTVGEG